MCEHTPGLFASENPERTTCVTATPFFN
jgi:hypothetical protein